MSWIDDLSLDPATDIPNGTEVDNVLWGSNVVQRFLDLATRVRTGNQRVQMVQTTAQSVTATTWTTLTGMSYATANGGYQGVTGMTAISAGLLTMPTGSAGQWAVSAAVSVQNATGLTTVRAAVLQNSTRVITSGEPGTDTGGFQGPSIPEFEFAVADGDKIGLQVYLVGANTTTSTMAANSSMSFLRLKKLP